MRASNGRDLGGSCLLPFAGFVALLLASASGCGSDSTGARGSGAGTGGTGGVAIFASGGAAGAGFGGVGSGLGGAYVLPQGFTATELGGYKLGDAITSGGDAGAVGPSSGCGSTILAVVRDFDTHPDFEAFSGTRETKGLVPNTIGADQKPGYTGICEASLTGNCPYGQQTTTKGNFDQWYRYTPGVNLPYVVYFSLEPNNGLLTFQSDLFFPLDGAGYGNSGTGEDGKQHNFGFTTEVHTQFSYAGGEKFTFIGDDDVWVFINGKLAVDLGGLHPSRTGSVDLDAAAGNLGITKGSTYNLDLFHAERHTSASHFRIDTNLTFTNCGTVVPEPPIP